MIYCVANVQLSTFIRIFLIYFLQLCSDKDKQCRCQSMAQAVWMYPRKPSTTSFSSYKRPAASTPKTP